MSIPVWTWRDAVAKAAVPTYTKALCWALANYMSDAGKACWPALETLAADAGMSERAATLHLKAAVKAGLLAVSRRRKADGTLGSYIFQPRFPDNAELVKASRPNEGGVSVDPPAPSAPGRKPPARDDTTTRTTCGSRTIHSELSKKNASARDVIEGSERRITKDTYQKIELMGVNVEPLLDQMRSSGKTYHNPNGYLLAIAKREASERLGVSQAVVDRLSSADMTVRAAAIVAATVASTSPKPHTARPSSALLASLGRAA